MRWLIVSPGPSFSVHDVFVGWCEALAELGEHVVGYRLDERLTFYDRALMPTPTPDVFRKALTAEQSLQLANNGIYAALYKVQPDVLMVVSGFFVSPEVYLRARANGTKIILVHTEEPYEHDRDIARAGAADLNLINDPTHLAAFSDIGPAFYIPHAYRPSLHHPGPASESLACDLAFCGTGYPSRVAFFEQMDLTGLDVILAGNWAGLTEDSPLWTHLAHQPTECLDNPDTAELYRAARCGINLYRHESTRPEYERGWALGPREIEMAACGLFFIREARDNGDDALDMLPSFVDPGDASEMIRWYLDHDEERTALAAKAREAIADRTFTNYATALLSAITGE